MGWLPAYFNAPVNDATSRSAEKFLRAKVLPLSSDPFDEKTLAEVELSGEEEEAEEEEGDAQAVPIWLELLFDLAWTATFSGLTSNTPVGTGSQVASYVVFFTLVWWLWISQVLYDTKFYANDWFHRFQLLCQFVMFGILAAFTSGFDITQGLKNDSGDSSSVLVNDLYIRHAFLAISIIFCISRVLLAVEYIRVVRYASNRRAHHLYVIIGALAASAILFLGAFLVTRSGPTSTVPNVIKFVMWGVAIGLEVLAYIFTSMPRGLVRQGSMPERLATLTTIIVGEGFNGLTGPLVSTVKSPGFNFVVGVQIFVVALVVFVVFMLYFSSVNIRATGSEAKRKVAVLLHYPTHLFIILTLEGLKTVLSLTTLNNSLLFFINKFNSALNSLDSDDSNTDDQGVATFTTAFGQVGLNFTADADKFIGQSPNGTDALQRLYADGFEALFNQFQVLDNDAQSNWTDYITANGTDSRAFQDSIFSTANPDSPSFGPGLDALLDSVENSLFAPISWICGIAGAYLISLGLLMLVNDLPRNRFTWWALLSRVFMGVALALLSFVNLSENAIDNWVTKGWFLPVIIIFFLIQYSIDYVSSVLMARYIHRIRPNMSSREASKVQLMPQMHAHRNQDVPYNPYTEADRI